MRRTGRYISEDFIRGFGENYVIKLDAHLGSGKTSSIEQFKHLKLLYIASSTQLIEQICQRYDWITSYIEEDGKTRKTQHDLRGVKQLAINYHSLHKLSDEADIDFDILIIDEPFALWEASTTYKINHRNENEFIYRICNTPKVIFMGGDYPNFITEEIQNITEKRPEHLGNSLMELKYSSKP